MTDQPFARLISREWQALLSDPWLLSLVTWIPLLLFFLLWAIMSAGIARDLPIAIVDLDHSAMSRALVRHYDGSPSLAVDTGFSDPQQGAAALRAGKMYAMIIIPADFEKMTILGHPPQVSAFVNSQFLLIGRIVNAALLQAQATFVTKVEMRTNLAVGPPIFDLALATALPVGTQATPLFNINTDYAQFLVAAMLPAAWQILMVAATVLSLAGEQRRQGMRQWLGTSPVAAFFSKLLPLALLFWLHGLLFLWFMYIQQGWPMHGSWPLLAFAQLLTVCASLSAASVFFFITLDATRGLSLAAAYAAPGLAFMGITFPVTDMSLWAKIWRSLLPINHYIEVQFGQVNYGASLTSALPQLTVLALFILPLLFSIYRAGRLAVPPTKDTPCT
ncbi:MAG: ABC transporter permease [Desulforhopalus sp.]|nr:ABC transporter permease [Desulforhopalus sp.]